MSVPVHACRCCVLHAHTSQRKTSPTEGHGHACDSQDANDMQKEASPSCLTHSRQVAGFNMHRKYWVFSTAW